MTKRNQWTRDELILALDLYFRVNPAHTSATNPEVIETSRLLRKLAAHPNPSDPASYRSPDAVYMKLCNFLRVDPAYQGAGLDAGSKKDLEVWNEFGADRQKLSSAASSIKSRLG
jgi:5-methylcytosine-specific restriction protein A